MDQKEKAIKLHREWNGKLVTTSKAPVKDREARVFDSCSLFLIEQKSLQAA